MNLDHFDDDRLLFYLNHHEEIDEWYALRTEAAQATEDFIVSLHPDIVESISARGDSIRSEISVTGQYRYLAFWRPSWADTESRSRPAISVVLQWDGGQTVLGSARNKPYVGARVEAGTNGPLYAQVAAGRSPKIWSKSTGLPAWRYLDPPHLRWWENLADCGASLVDATVEAWNLFAPSLDRRE